MKKTGLAAEFADAPVIVWFRADLRLRDNGALRAAVDSGRAVIALYIFDETADPALGGAQRWWLHHSLSALGADLEGLGLRLILRRGDPATVLDELIAQTGARTVLWNRRYTPTGVRTDTAIKAGLSARGLVAASASGALLHEPTHIETGDGGYYKVYSPFWRAFRASGEPRLPSPAPARATPYADQGSLASDRPGDWGLLPTGPDWSCGLAASWTPGEAAAQAQLKAFLERALDGYADKRDLPGIESTSRLSPYLAFGEITPFDIWHAAATAPGINQRDLEKFHKELAWREFSYHLLFHFPTLKQANFNSDFDAFAWAGKAEHLHAWQTGQTGYPIVDAGMRQLWQTGWIHNRVRMVVASFLVKHLLIDWRHGEQWFWDTLVDADPASNTASWQWVAGSGADAAPYFRVFNPILQGEKFDGDGAYVRAYVPELAGLPEKVLHKPWEADEKTLSKAGVSLGETYPRPIIDHKRARGRALDAYKQLRGQAA